MNPEELQHRYQHLRRELDAAYSAVQWDPRRIDLITEQMRPLERALSTAHALWADVSGERSVSLSGPAGQ
jgi:hypothetical protein